MTTPPSDTQPPHAYELIVDNTPRVLTGLQPSGQLHLGNYAGAISQLRVMQDKHPANLYVFVASYHALTSLQNGQAMRDAVRQVVTDYLAFGLDPEKAHIYLQQHVPAVCELAWMLSCVCPKSQMDKATSYKDKVAKGLGANIGLYTYPILQAADILAVDADLVPVGKDQVQHVEIARDLAGKFNRAFDAEVFKEPKYVLKNEAALLPGVDGGKMSKSTGNGIDPFMPEKKLRKRIMSIVSGSETMEEPKDPEHDTTFQIFRGLIGSDDPRTQELAAKYRAGNFGYGHAKQALFEAILEEFKDARAKRQSLMDDPGYVDEVLAHGAAAANLVIAQVRDRARRACGL